MKSRAVIGLASTVLATGLVASVPTEVQAAGVCEDTRTVRQSTGRKVYEHSTGQGLTVGATVTYIKCLNKRSSLPPVVRGRHLKVWYKFNSRLTGGWLRGVRVGCRTFKAGPRNRDVMKFTKRPFNIPMPKSRTDTYEAEHRNAPRHQWYTSPANWSCRFHIEVPKPLKTRHKRIVRKMD
jgi:hypothetical protein